MTNSRRLPTLAASLLAVMVPFALVSPAGAAKRPVTKPIAGKPPRAGVNPATALTTLLGASRSARTRTGMGLPPYTKLLGRNAAKRARAADAAFLKQATTPARAKARAAAKTVEEVLDGDPLKAGDAVRGTGGRQTRKMRISGSIESGACPRFYPSTDPTLPGSFDVKGNARGDYEVTTVERVGRYDVTTAVVMETRFEVHAGTVSSGAVDSIFSAGGTVSITRTQTARDRRTGKTRRTGPAQRYTSELSPLLILEGSFEAFIEAQDSDEAPAPRRVLRSSAWSETAQNFVAIVYLHMERYFDTVRKNALTPNACVSLSFNGPERLAPSQAVPLTGLLRLNTGDAPQALLLENAHVLASEWINHQGQTARLLSPRPGDWKVGEPWYEFTAPPQAWPESKPVGFDFTIGSYAGVAKAGISFKPLESTLHFRVLGASFRNHTSATGQDSYCGTQGGSVDFSGDFVDNGFSPEDKIELGGSRIKGEIEGNVRARWTNHHVTGCESNPAGAGQVACAKTMPDREQVGFKGVSFSVSSAADPSNVTLSWAFDQPSVGFVDAGDDECNSHIWGAFDQTVAKRTVPISTFQGTGPVTLKLEGTGNLDTNRDGMVPANITHSWSYVLTIQRVGSDGRPLG